MAGDLMENQEIQTQDELPLPTRKDIVWLQEELQKAPAPLPIPTHFFAPGMYLRELTVPAGMVIVGKIHKHAHFLLVTKGSALVVSEFGRDHVTAGHISVSQPGVKRVVYAFEDTQFVTVHVNKDDLTDIEAIEAEHVEHEVLRMPHEMKEVIQ